jgi:prepilin-type N-terminal cleavage/methylation domain-containing protein
MESISSTCRLQTAAASSSVQETIQGPAGVYCRTARPDSGLTLIELTVVLAVILTLALILTPSIANFVNDSRVARAQGDCQTLASAIVQFYSDTGFYPQWKAAMTGGPGFGGDRLNVLTSDGNVPLEGQQGLWTGGSSGAIVDQLMTNAPGYLMRTARTPFGWNGPYLSSGIGTDPWNNRYLINVGLLEPGVGVHNPDGSVKGAVWVISAGPNGIVETPYFQNVLSATLGGDDIGIRVQ